MKKWNIFLEMFENLLKLYNFDCFYQEKLYLYKNNKIYNVIRAWKNYRVLFLIK